MINSNVRRIAAFVLAFACFSLALTSFAQAEDPPKVKVFIMAGQSNMEGKAQVSLLDHQITAPETAELFAHLHVDGEYIVRDDVWVEFLGHRGGLTPGFGSPDRIGPELQFGTVVGDHFDAPVLLIKTAWGGHSLYKNFRPPSAGLPSDAVLQETLDQANERIRSNNEKNPDRNEALLTMDDITEPFGLSYRNMMQEVETTLADMDERFPEYEGQGYEIAGFVWFQGFNDQFGDYASLEYEENMEHFIRDVRRDLELPELPFVIAALGTNGSKEAQGGGLAVREAQLAMNDVPDFEGNVYAFRTDVMADTVAEGLIDGWQNHVEEWQKVGSDRPYHYLGSTIWYGRIGTECGEGMLELMGEK